MAYVRFDGCDYVYFDKYYHRLFTGGKEHRFLFEYISKDLSCLPELLEQYVSMQMDTNTLKLSSKKHQGTEVIEIIETIKDILTSAHPYYKHNYEITIVKEIGRYFNGLLMYLGQEAHSSISSDVTEAWYVERVHRLLQPLAYSLPEAIEAYIGTFYNEYQQNMGTGAYTLARADPSAEIVDSRAPSRRPTGFSHEIQTQKEISNMLYLILDISVPRLAKLTLFQRAWIYGNIFGASYNESMTKVSQKWSMLSPCKSGGENSDQTPENNLYNVFGPLFSLTRVNLGHDGIPEALENQMAEAVELAEAQETNPIYMEYEVDDLRQLAYLEILLMIQEDTMIKKCKRCGKYFVVTNRNVAYCERVDESGVRCSEVGSHQNFQKKMASDEALQIYNRAYKAHHARVRKGAMSKEDFRLWYKEAKAKLEQVRAGELDIDNFQRWLKI